MNHTFRLIDETHFVRLVPLTRPINNPMHFFLINPNIILHHVLFINYLWIYEILLVSIGLKPTERKFAAPFNPVFFILLIVKSLDTLPKHSA